MDNLYNEQLWTEKYRPQKFDELLVDDDVLNIMKGIIQRKIMPNIIISGSPGTGKTTTIHCLARTLFGGDCDDYIFEINASDDRGIKTNEMIETFCDKKISKIQNGCRHKIIILDEADNMTLKCQQLIKKIMGRYIDSVRFAFTCNTSSAIIEGIQSNCVILRYNRLSNQQVFSKLIEIADKEDIKYAKNAIDKLSQYSRGDLRKAINFLQILSNSGQKITIDNIAKIYCVPEHTIMESLFKLCCQHDYLNARMEVITLFDIGYTNSDILFAMFNTLSNTKKIEQKIEQKKVIEYLNIIGEHLFISSKGVNSKLQIMACIFKLCGVE